MQADSAVFEQADVVSLIVAGHKYRVEVDKAKETLQGGIGAGMEDMAVMLYVLASLDLVDL